MDLLKILALGGFVSKLAHESIRGSILQELEDMILNHLSEEGSFFAHIVMVAISLENTYGSQVLLKIF